MATYFLYRSSMCNLECSLQDISARLDKSLFRGLPSMWWTCSSLVKALPKCLAMTSLCSSILPYSEVKTHLYGFGGVFFPRDLFFDIFWRMAWSMGVSCHRSFAAFDIFSLWSKDFGRLTYSKNTSYLSRLSMPNFIILLRTVLRCTFNLEGK